MSEKRLGEVIDADRPGRRAGARRHQRHARRRSRRRGPRSFRCCTWRPACARGATDMPEERNRVQTDRLADVLFAPTEAARANLEAEEVQGTVHVTGDPLCDMLLGWAPRLSAEPGGRRAMCWPPSTATTTPTIPSACSSCSTALAPPRGPWCSPCTRGPGRKIENGGLDVPPATWSCATRCTYSVMLALERGARGGGNRLRRRAARGLRVGGARA